MKTKTKLMLLLCCGACFACNAPQQDKREGGLTNRSENMTNVELREKIVMALDDMKAKAIEMGIEGVATASVLNKGETADWMGEMRVLGVNLNIKPKR